MFKNLCCVAMRTDLGSHQEMDCISVLPALSVLDRTRGAWEVITGNVQTEHGFHFWCVAVVGSGVSAGLEVRLPNLWGSF